MGNLMQEQSGLTIEEQLQEQSGYNNSKEQLQSIFTDETIENLNKEQSGSGLEEQVKQVKELLQARVDDYNAIFDNFHTKNDRIVANLNVRLDAIASSPIDFPMKKKSIAKIKKYLLIILAEAEELKLKPKKARIKDIERLIKYFDIMDKFIGRIERKILYKIIQIEKNNIFASENFAEYNDNI